MHVIPAPLSVKKGEGSFLLKPEFVVRADGDVSREVAEYLIPELRQKFALVATLVASDTPALRLKLEGAVDLLDGVANREEAYVLDVTSQGILIRAEKTAGLFYGVQTFLQLLCPTQKLHPEDSTSIPCMQIVDAPQFGWRGALLDVGRHFFEVPFIKQFIDHLAFYKLNRFHWHLTEDQGWRIEIKSYPRLTEVGAWREARDGDGKYGGYYSQEEIKEIVAYAKARCIQVVPEIEMPGHCAASLAAYPDLSCREDIAETPSRWGVYEDVYCGGKDRVFEFLKGVLEEVVALFPFEYIHVGGDEAPRDRWRSCEKCQERIRTNELVGEDELQSWFISEIAEFLTKHKRKIIGWDEILEGGIPKDATVMSWRGVLGGFIAAKLGHDVIMTPTSHCYLDYRQADSPDEPGAYYATLTLESVYGFDPIPDAQLLVQLESPTSSDVLPSSQMEVSEMSEVTVDTSGMEVDEGRGRNGCDEATSDLRPEQKLADDIQNGRISTGLTDAEQQHILGGQANVWTEYIEDAETCEYMLLPRLCAFGEAVWSAREHRDLDSFQQRLEEHTKLFEVLDVRYRPVTRS